MHMGGFRIFWRVRCRRSDRRCRMVIPQFPDLLHQAGRLSRGQPWGLFKDPRSVKNPILHSFHSWHFFLSLSQLHIPSHPVHPLSHLLLPLSQADRTVTDPPFYPVPWVFSANPGVSAGLTNPLAVATCSGLWRSLPHNPLKPKKLSQFILH